VAIDDRNVRLIAYNSQTAAVDDVRVASIMQRAVSKDLVRYIHDAGALAATDMFTVPPRPDLGLEIERIGLPVRYQGALLGFLWLLASDGPVDDLQLEAARQTADKAAQALHHEHLLGELSRGRKRELLRDLLSPEPRLCREASDHLLEEELLSTGPVTVIVVKVTHDNDQPLDEKERLAVAASLERARQPLPHRTAIQLQRPDHGILAVVRSGSRHETYAAAERLHHEVCAETSRPAGDWQVGVGEERKGLPDARFSYMEAKRAAEVASVVRTLGSVARYSRLGVYGLLAELPRNQLSLSIHPGLRRLLQEDADDVLVRTLEAFLDSAGNVQQAAARLCVHRATVYYRLDRIEQVADVKLSSGDDRFALHLGLKVAHLIGLR
jgi:hypothetical protein